MMNKDIYKSIYAYDKITDSYQIEMSINNFHELFDEWDGSTIRKKDLDPEMVDYMIEAVRDLPKNANINIIFTIRNQPKNKELEDIAHIAFDQYFNFRIFLNTRKTRRILKTASFYLILGFGFIFSAYKLGGVIENLSSSILSEGLFIGGWVFIWESMSLIFFKSASIYKESKRFKKIIACKISYKYKK